MDYPNNVQFDSDQTSAMTALYNKNKQESGKGGFSISKFLIKKGIVKDQKSASKLLIGIAVVIFLVSAYLLYSTSAASAVNPVGGI